MIAAKRRVTSCQRWTVTENEQGIPAVAWHFGQNVLDVGVQLHLLDLLDTAIRQTRCHRPETVNGEVRA
ncbi:hypothetical protein [Streptomyces sp. NPDC026589]|uniref:hypothetical protein n=1 Tax=Streptomyces sp. NPDC026589 TaxID=3155609 RepID=UPI00340EEB06